MESTDNELEELYALVQTLKFASSAATLSKYFCNYCGKICLEAFEAKCRHLYCKSCVDKLCKIEKSCPLDKTSLKREEFTRNEAVQEEIKKLSVFCPYQRSGCLVAIQLQRVPKHLQICEYAPLLCPQGCSEPVNPNDLENHLQFTCTFRHVSCDFCEKTYVLARRQKHLLECSRYPIDCPNECGVPAFPQEELSKHLQECCVKLHLCRHQHLGCKYRGTGSTLRLHESDVDLHFKLMSEGFAYLNLNFDILMQETKSNILLLQNENCALRESLKEVIDQCQTLTDSEDDVQEKLALLRLTTYKLMQHKDLFADQKESVEVDKDDKDIVMPKKVSDELIEQLKIVQEIKFKMQDEMMKRMEIQDEKIKILSRNCSGTLIWKIENYHRRKEESLSRRRPFEFSEPFLTDPFGYQVCGKVYLGGEGEARGTHLSLYIIVMRGPNDNILSWPFPHKFHLSLLDQKHTHEKQHRGEHFSPNNSSSFQKPSTAMNTGAGLTKFLPLTDIEGNDTYLRNDTIYIRIVVFPIGDKDRFSGKQKKSKKSA